MRRLDLGTINRDDFQVIPVGEPRGRLLLVLPAPMKQRWQPHEFELRSLLCTPDGTVVSTGFPKFHNLGEHPDTTAAFHRALAAGRVTVVDKVDGSLIVADRLEGAAHLRTRGRHDLADRMAADVRELVATRYPGLLAVLDGRTGDPEVDAVSETHSILLEFTSPRHVVIVPYAEPQLTLLAVVDKRSRTPSWDPAVLGPLARAIGADLPRAGVLPATEPELRAAVAAMDGREGCVARFVDEDGVPQMVKLKSDWYRIRHAFKAEIGNPARTRRILWWHGVTTAEAAERLFAAMGLDYETRTVVEPILHAYLAERARLRTRLGELTAALDGARGARAEAVAAGGPAALGAQKAWAERVRATLAQQVRPDETPGAAFWFPFLVADTDPDPGRPVPERLQAGLEAQALGESVHTLRLWRREGLPGTTLAVFAGGPGPTGAEGHAAAPPSATRPEAGGR